MSRAPFAQKGLKNFSLRFQRPFTLLHYLLQCQCFYATLRFFLLICWKWLQKLNFLLEFGNYQIACIIKCCLKTQMSSELTLNVSVSDVWLRVILDKNFQYREDKWIWHLMLRVQRGIVTVFDFCSTAQEPNFVGLIWSLNIRETDGIEETALFKVSHNSFVCLTITFYDSQDFIDHDFVNKSRT